MDLRLPITTINGEPIDDLRCALPALLDSLAERLEAIQRGEGHGRIVLVPCLRRALVPIWIELRLAHGDEPPELSPTASLLTLITAVRRLVDQVGAAADHNWSRSAA